MREIKLTLPGSIRIKKNSKRIFGYGGFKKVLPSKAYEAWEKQARESIPDEFYHDRFYPSECPVSVSARFYYTGQRPDLSGAMESIGDALQGYFWTNDGQIFSWDGSRMHHDLKNPRTELIIRFYDSDMTMEEACKIADEIL